MGQLKPGKQFEKDFKDSAQRDGIYIERFHDSTNSWDGGQQTKFTPKNPYDSVLYWFPVMLCCELKSTQGTSFSFDEKIIKKNQIDKLSEASEHKGIIPGFVFNFRATNHTYFVHIDEFIKFKASTTKKSLNESDCKSIGVPVEQQQKKVNWKYSIRNMVEDLQNKYLNQRGV